MIAPRIPENETQRLEALKEYSILDTLPEKEYDDITFLASYICQTPVALISIIDDKRQWFKSHHGIEATETPKQVAFCAHAINEKNQILVVPDSRKDERFFDNPLVTDAPHVVFYVGIPLVNPDGFPLGTLCVIDSEPRELNDIQIKGLKALSDQLMKLFELRKNSSKLNQLNTELKAKNKGLDEFVRVAAHDLKSPLNSIVMLSDVLVQQYNHQLDKTANELVDHIHRSANNLTKLIDGILKYSKDSGLVLKDLEILNIEDVLLDVVDLVEGFDKIHFNLSIADGCSIYTNKIALEQIFVNLITNSVKYCDKEQVEITIEAKEVGDYLVCNVIDNGPGIKDEDKARIFDLFQTGTSTDNKGAQGTGIGLATVKTLIERLGGQITVYSELGNGANFEFLLKK
jgi:signal transduction histidine kinase